MKTTVSQDGTPIAYEQLGSGPTLVLVGGTSSTHGLELPFAEALADRFSVVVYDRRGRGESGDTAPYAVQRELEDLAAVVAAAGGGSGEGGAGDRGSAGGVHGVYGISSGGALVLRAAAAGLAASRVAVYEVPYTLDPAAHRAADASAAEVRRLLADGDRGGAVEVFLRRVGTPPEVVAGMRQAPVWAGFEAVAPTLAYDDAILGGGRIPTDDLARINVPVLVVAGGASDGWWHETARAVTAAVPDGRYASLPGQDHRVTPEALAPVLAEFFG